MCKLKGVSIINVAHRPLVQCSLPLPMPFPHSDPDFYHPKMPFSESNLSIHHKLPYRQHSLQPHSEGEYLLPPYVHCVLICTKGWGQSEESNMVSKCNHKKDYGQETNAAQYSFLALFFQIQEIANTPVTISKHNASILLAPANMLSLLEEHIDAQMSQKMPMALHVWQKQCSEQHSLLSKEIQGRSIFKLSNKKLAIQPSELINKNAHKCPIPGANHLHDRMLQPQATSLANSHTQ